MIHFIQHDRPFRFTGKRQLKLFIADLFLAEGRQVGNINYIFCSDDYLLQVNRDFLQHDYYTDIITFDLSAGPAVDAEIYISVDRVRDNAQTYAVTLQAELLRVMFHGALHLCGYGDKTKREITMMRQKESEYLRKFDQANP